MQKFVTAAAAAFALVLAALLGTSTADALPRLGASAMWVRAENPTAEQLGAQVAAISNPANSDADRRANIYDSDGPNRPALDMYFQYIKTVKAGDVKYELGTPRRQGNNITMRIKSSAKGMGSYDEDHYWVRQDGRWKYDVIRWCKTSASCPGKDLLR